MKEERFWGNTVFSATKEQLMDDPITRYKLEQIYLSDRGLFKKIAKDARLRFGIDLEESSFAPKKDD